ncbi:MAG: S9 family peptidase [Gemmatimonadaceae bacterium]|nr:S9 family peptidase [Gemmatimonadaceae bacterium]
MLRRILGLSLLAMPLVAQSGTRSPAIDSLLSIRAIGTPRLSPDGRQVAYLMTSTDWKADRFVAQLWLQDADSGVAHQLTRRDDGVSQPRWSPNGEWLAFVGTRDGKGKPQVFALAVSGGEPLQLTKAEDGVASYAWSPDGQRLAYTASHPDRAREARDSSYGGFDVVRRDYARLALFVLNVDSAMVTPQVGDRRTQGTAWSVGAFEWSPDGAAIAFDAQRTPDPVTASTADIYVLHLATDSVRAVVTRAGPDGDPHWSPDGTQLLYTESVDYFHNAHLAVVPANGGASRIVTATFDEQPQFVAWSRDGVLFSAQQRTASHLFRLDVAQGTVTRVSGPDPLAGSGWSLSRDAQRVAFVQASPTALPELAVAQVASFAPRTLSHQSEQITEWKLGTREVVRWKSRDGAEIEGILIKPRDFDPSRKYPLLCVIHGGPTGVDRPVLPDARTYPVDLWVNRGALVLKVNYRGSAGYGERFRGLNYRNLGVGDAWDVVSGVDALIAKGFVDPARVASMGWSQGGYISAFLTTTSTRFAAISVGAGISDWRTYYYNTDITPFTINYLGADPVADPAIYAKTSPVDYVKNAKTPTLIQHGELDRRVPIANGYQLRQALEDRGVPVEMIVYKGFGHGITKPKSQRAVMQHNLAWFNHYIFGDPMPDFTRMVSVVQ